MPTPPQAPDEVARRQRRRWLAKRRCNWALRATLIFIVLVTPFCYFGYVLCCHMPIGFRRTLPNWILLFECWLFVRNTYVFFRYVWLAPGRALLPIGLSVWFIIFNPFGPTWHINHDFYFNLFREDRMEIVRMIGRGELIEDNKDQGRVLLPHRYQHTSFQDGTVNYAKMDNGTSVLFPTGWNILATDQGFLYTPDDIPSNWIRTEKLMDMERLEPCWQLIVPRFGYLQYIMRSPWSMHPTSRQEAQHHRP
jgi:hypothetical protein